MIAPTFNQKPNLSSARFYAILDSGYVSSERWVDACQALLEGGADIIQLRAKEQSSEQRRALLERILPLFETSATPLIINDDLDLALSYPGLGLHVGQDDIPVAEARGRLGPERLLGLSTHSKVQARAAIEQASVLDYFAVGPVFATPTKPTYEPVGLELVNCVAGFRPNIPWFCIGGIKLGNLNDILAAGGQRVVVVSEALQADSPVRIVKSYLKRIPPPVSR